MNITITLNEKPIEIKNDFTILKLLQQVKSPMSGVAVAINNEIIPQNSWETAQLKSKDQLLIIQATQGG